MMLDARTQKQSVQALAEFSAFLRQHLDESCFEDTGSVEFHANVSYTANGKVKLGQAVVYIVRNGYSDGTVSLRSSKEFDAHKVHTEYTPEWQKYFFDESAQTFTVTGDSTKYSYSYSVVISPI